MNARRHQPSNHSQRGSVMIVALMLLLVLTILGVTSMSNMTLEQRMAMSYQRMEDAYNVAQDETNDEMARWNKTVLEAAGTYNPDDDYIRAAFENSRTASESERCSKPFEKDRDVTPADHNSGTTITASMSTVYQGGKVGMLLTPGCDSCVAETFNITADAQVTVGSSTLGRSTQTQTVNWIKQGGPTECPSS